MAKVYQWYSRIVKQALITNLLTALSGFYISPIRLCIPRMQHLNQYVLVGEKESWDGEASDPMKTNPIL